MNISKVLYIRYTDENKNRQYHFSFSTYSLEVGLLQSQKRICRREWNKTKCTCTSSTCSNTFPNTWLVCNRNPVSVSGTNNKVQFRHWYRSQNFFSKTFIFSKSCIFSRFPTFATSSRNHISKGEIYLPIVWGFFPS